MGNLVGILLAPLWIAAFILEIIWKIIGPTAQAALGGIRGMFGSKPDTGAEFASTADLKKKGYLEPKGGYLVGLSGGKRVFTNHEDSVLIVGRKGAGKSQTMIASIRAYAANVHGYRPDIIVSDPVGELQKATEQQLRDAGYGVIVLNLADPKSATFGYNPLNFLDPSDPYEFDLDVTTLAELLVPPDAKTRDEHFVDIAQAMVASAVGYFVKYEPSGATVAKVARALAASKAGFDGLVSKIEKVSDPIILQGVTAVNAAGQKNERGSIFTSMSRKLRPFMTNAVERVTDLGVDGKGHALRGWTWEQVLEGERPVVVYIRTGLGRGAVSGPFVRLVMGNAINTARRILSKTGKPLRKGLRIFVDEARDVGNCRAIIDANNELRKANVSVFLCYLSMKDITNAFPDADTLIGGCALLVPGGMNDIKFYEEVSRTIGDAKSFSHSEYEDDNGTRKGRSESYERLFRADQLRRLPRGEFILVMDDVAARVDKPFGFKKGKPVYG
jgi:type IV secretory pathway TraG/TraD family ATPase VirD4